MTTTSVFLDVLFACLQVIALAGLGIGLVWMLTERARHPISDAPPERHPESIIVMVAQPVVMPTSEIVIPPHIAAHRFDRPSISITD